MGHQALIAVLIAARENAGMSQREVSKALKRASNFVNYIETGQHIPSALEFIAIAGVLGVSPTVLMGRVMRRLKVGS